MNERPGLPEPKRNIVRRTILQAKLVWKLLFDRRVNFFLKLIPVAGLAYVVFPFDFIPDLAPIIGQVDDLGILIGSLWLFVDLIPQAIVQEHWQNLTGVITTEWRDVTNEPSPDSPPKEIPSTDSK